MCVQFTVYNCCTQYCTEQTWKVSLLPSRKSPLLRWCLFEGKGGRLSGKKRPLNRRNSSSSSSSWRVLLLTWERRRCHCEHTSCHEPAVKHESPRVTRVYRVPRDDSSAHPMNSRRSSQHPRRRCSQACQVGAHSDPAHCRKAEIRPA